MRIYDQKWVQPLLLNVFNFDKSSQIEGIRSSPRQSTDMILIVWSVHHVPVDRLLVLKYCYSCTGSSKQLPLEGNRMEGGGGLGGIDATLNFWPSPQQQHLTFPRLRTGEQSSSTTHQTTPSWLTLSSAGPRCPNPPLSFFGCK